MVLWVNGCASLEPVLIVAAVRHRGGAAALLAGVAALLGCSSADSNDAGTPLAVPTAFQVHGKLSLTPHGPAAITSPPTEQDFLLYVDPGASTVVSFAAGNAWGTVATMKGTSFDVTAGFNVGLLGSCVGSDVWYSSFHFAVDAAAGTVTGTGRGSVDLYVGDEGFSYDAALTFTGTRDSAGPALDLPSAMDPFHPSDLRATRPLPSTATAQLVAAGDTITLEPIQLAGGPVLGWSLPDTALPRYGTAYDLLITPWQDLAGNAGAPLGQVMTRPAPRLVAREDFEDPAGASGDGLIVDGTVLPPISGQRSAVLHVHSGLDSSLALDSPHVTARLQVAPGDTVVRFSARPFGSATLASPFGVHMQVGVPGGAITAAVLPASQETLSQTSSAGGYLLGDVRTIEIPLPDGATSEVIVDLSATPPSPCSLPVPGPVGYLIDDLRVE